MQLQVVTTRMGIFISKDIVGLHDTLPCRTEAKMGGFHREAGEWREYSGAVSEILSPPWEVCALYFYREFPFCL